MATPRLVQRTLGYLQKIKSKFDTPPPSPLGKVSKKKFKKLVEFSTKGGGGVSDGSIFH